MSEESIPFRGIRNDEAVYRALDVAAKEIRCLVIGAGSGDADVVCSLEYLALSQEHRVQYEALSYCWGSLAETAEIVLQYVPVGSTMLVGQTFKVTPNLKCALKNLRYEDRNRRLWVDAVCINQMDPLERSQQLELMGKIYESSQKVVVWLGEADTFSNVATNSMRHFISVIDVYYDAPSPPTPNEIAMLKRWEALGLPAFNVKPGVNIDLLEELYGGYEGVERLLPIACMADTTLREGIERLLALMDIPWQSSDTEDQFEKVTWIVNQCINELMARPWFRRVWVIQEIFRAPLTSTGDANAVLCLGTFRIPWFDFCTFANTFARFRKRATQHPLTLLTSNDVSAANFFHDNWADLWYWTRHIGYSLNNRKPGFPFPITEVLRLTKSFEASDPRDKLFAVLHLAENTQDMSAIDARIRPNYFKSVDDVLVDFATWHLESAESLDLLCLANAEYDPSQHKGRPSWAVDFSDSGGDWPLAELLASPPGQKLSCCMERANKEDSRMCVIRELSMFVKGVHLSTVEAVDPCTLGYDPKTGILFTDQPRRAKEMIGFMLDKYWDPRRERSDAVFVRKCLSLFGYFGRRAAEIKGFISYFKGLELHLADQEYWHAFEREYSHVLGMYMGFCNHAWSFIKGRRLFRCQDGDFGTCPTVTRPNDVIVALQGGKLPMILRPTGRKYCLIGPCVMHGKKWMNGEAERYREQNNIAMDLFEIV